MERSRSVERNRTATVERNRSAAVDRNRSAGEVTVEATRIRREAAVERSRERSVDRGETRSADRNRGSGRDGGSYDRNRGESRDGGSYDRNRSGESRNRGGNDSWRGDNRSRDSRSRGDNRSYGDRGSRGNNRSYGHNRSGHRGRPYFHHGRVSRWAPYGGGYRVWIVGAPYPFFVPHSHWHRDRFRIGLSIRLGGYYNSGGYYDYYDGVSGVSEGALRGIVESVDHRRDTFVIRNDATGSFVTVILRDRREDVRAGDYVELYGDWSRNGVFQAHDVDLLN